MFLYVSFRSAFVRRAVTCHELFVPCDAAMIRGSRNGTRPSTELPIVVASVSRSDSSTSQRWRSNSMKERRGLGLGFSSPNPNPCSIAPHRSLKRCVTALASNQSPRMSGFHSDAGRASKRSARAGPGERASTSDGYPMSPPIAPRSAGGMARRSSKI